MSRQSDTLTVAEAVERTGVARSVILDRLARGLVPDARRMPGGAWAIPAAHLEHVDPRHDTGPAPSGGTGPGRLASDGLTVERLEPTPAPALRELVDAARRVEVATSSTTTRAARAAADAVWFLVELAARHEPDRDGTCRHDGWAYPCPDRRDAVEGLEVVTRWILEGEGAR